MQLLASSAVGGCLVKVLGGNLVIIGVGGGLIRGPFANNRALPVPFQTAMHCYLYEIRRER